MGITTWESRALFHINNCSLLSGHSIREESIASSQKPEADTSRERQREKEFMLSRVYEYIYIYIFKKLQVELKYLLKEKHAHVKLSFMPPHGYYVQKMAKLTGSEGGDLGPMMSKGKAEDVKKLTAYPPQIPELLHGPWSLIRKKCQLLVLLKPQKGGAEERLVDSTFCNRVS